MSLDKPLEELARHYIYSTRGKTDRAAIQVAAMNYIRDAYKQSPGRSASLRRAFFERVEYYRERARSDATYHHEAMEAPEDHEITSYAPLKWWEGC